jgi:hypothetical protein
MKLNRLLSTLILLLVLSGCRNHDQWFPFNPEKGEGISLLDQSHWLDAPAGKHGFLKMDSDHFNFGDGTPVKFWGVNICSEKPYVSNEVAELWVNNLKSYGVNAVRFHKFTRDALTGNTSVNPDSAMMTRFDFFHNQLKNAGIYYGWSPVYGHIPLPGDSARLVSYSEVKNSGLTDHLKGSSIGLVNFAEDLQDLQMELILNLLNRKNTLTGLKYAEDPALIFVEIQNEDNIYFATTQRVLETCPTYRAILAGRFSDWLKQKYGTQENLLKNWGSENFNFAREFSKDTAKWHLLNRNICPIANHGVFDYEYKKAVEKNTIMPAYLLDMLAFLYLQQQNFYDKAVSMIRSTGYKGAIVASCWQAGSGVSHFYNLYNDFQTGIIDRHNYFGGGTGHRLQPGKVNNESMLETPGSGLLSTGLQKVQGRPFVFSEWMSLVPNEWTAEAVPLIAAYGMGLQGWDGSFAFASNDITYSPTIQSANHGVYNVESPIHLGLYPAISNMIYRNDIIEGELLGTRNVNIPSLKEGKIGFVELSDQMGDQKSFRSTIPLETLAIGKFPVAFTSGFSPTPAPDLRNWLDTINKTITATNRQLEWHYGKRPWFTINSPGTIGFVGFLPSRPVIIGDVTLESSNEFAVILISSMNPRESVQSAQKLIITTLARARNTGMKYNEDHTELLEVGTEPVLLEPVRFSLSLKRKGEPKITILDHLGYKTTRTIKSKGEGLKIDGGETHAIYYLVEY